MRAVSRWRRSFQSILVPVLPTQSPRRPASSIAHGSRCTLIGTTGAQRWFGEQCQQVRQQPARACRARLCERRPRERALFVAHEHEGALVLAGEQQFAKETGGGIPGRIAALPLSPLEDRVPPDSRSANLDSTKMREAPASCVAPGALLLAQVGDLGEDDALGPVIAAGKAVGILGMAEVVAGSEPGGGGSEKCSLEILILRVEPRPGQGPARTLPRCSPQPSLPLGQL